MAKQIGHDFFDAHSCLELSRKLLGKILCRKLEGEKIILRGRIVETEAYLGAQDAASYTFGGRRTPANEPMYMPAGTCFVRLTYGMYHCFNISSKDEGACVLLRAIEPLEGIEMLTKLRRSHPKAPANDRFFSHPHTLANGPSKLCISFKIDPSLNKVNLLDDDAPIWLEYSDNEEGTSGEIVEATRVGISIKNAAASNLLRFYLKDNTSVSIK